MKRPRRCFVLKLFILAVLLLPLFTRYGLAQTCQSASEMEAPVKSGLESAAQRYFAMTAKGDVAGLQQSSIPSVASNFGGIEAAIKDVQPRIAGAQPTLRSSWLLQASSDLKDKAEFLCGVFGAHGQTANSAAFQLSNLSAGNYAIAIFDVAGTKAPETVSFVLQQAGTEWKLAGFYAKPAAINGHDGAWFADRARQFQAKGQNRNAWLYFMQARDLVSPLTFMSTAMTDQLYDEMQPVQASDLPVNGSTVDLQVGGKVEKLTSIFPAGFGDDLDLVVKYQAPDVSNTGATFQANMAVIKAVVAKYPEFRDAFAGVIARAVDPSGRDYGTLLPMKDIK